MFRMGLKLGMFAAMFGGGIMGYTTGKMLEEHGLVHIFHINTSKSNYSK